MSDSEFPRRLSVAWWYLARRPAPRVHAGLAFLVGAGLYAFPQFALVGFLLVGPTVAVGFGALGLVIAALAFGALGVGFLGKHAAWLAITAVPWAGGSILAFGLGISIGGGQLDRDWWFPPLLSGIAPVAIALLAHRGPTRTVSLFLIAGSAATCIVALSINGHQQHLAEGQRRFGSNVHPVVTSVDRTQRAQVQAFPGSETTVGPYLTADPKADGTYPVVFFLLTEPDRGPACGPVLYGETGTEAQVACTRSGSSWIRTSATRHEVAAVVDGHLVRAVGPKATTEKTLKNALASARPMNAWEYEALMNDQF